MTGTLGTDWQNGGFGLYVHWPFCAAKCPYCDFNSHVSARIDHTRWRDAYLLELDRLGRNLPGRVLDSIFLGGGTPSLMDPETVSAIVARAGEIWTLANQIEISLEANPGSVEATRLRNYQDCGVNRVSIGVQALRDEDLARLGRVHSVSDALDSITMAQSLFPTVSMDLIYARQFQTPANWSEELSRALALGTDHLSLYQLVIEDGTVFGRRHRSGRLHGLPDEGMSAEMYGITRTLCRQAGMHRYEVSNHARNGAWSRHNMIYWRYGDYAGIGPGAHGRITVGGQRFATESVRAPEDWLSRAAHGETETRCKPLTPTEQAEEYVIMGLRISEGIDIERYHTLSGHRLNDGILDRLCEMGLVSVSSGRVAATNRGFALLDSVTLELLAGAH